MSDVKEFKINEHLRVVLSEYGIEVRFINYKFFRCYHVPIKIEVKQLTTLNEIQPFDEFQEAMNFEKELLRYGVTPKTIIESNFKKVPKEDLFWVQCSNLQVWAENDYNSNLLPNRIAFPLLKKLVEVGDLKAKEVFEKEIVKRLESNHLPTINFLLEEGYLSYLGGSKVKEQMKKVFSNLDTKAIKGFDVEEMKKTLKYLTKNGEIFSIPKSLKSELFELFQKGTIEEMVSVLYGICDGEINAIKKEEIDQLFVSFDYSVIEATEFPQIRNLLAILWMLGHSNSEIYRNIVLRAIKDEDKLEDIINHLIFDDTLKILTEEELESIPVKELSFYSEEQELYELPDSLGNLKQLEKLDLSYAEHLRNFPRSILQLKNLKIVKLPSWSRSFKLPQWIDQLRWIGKITFRISICDVEKIFNLEDYFSVFSGPEIAKFYNKLHSLQYRSYEKFEIPGTILNLFEVKLRTLTDNLLLSKIEELTIDFIDLIFKIIDQLGSRNIKNNAIEAIGKRFSSISKAYVKKKKNSEISKMLQENWLELLIKEDFLELNKAEQLRFLKTIIEVKFKWEYDWNSQVGKPIYDFFERYKSLLNAPLKQMVAEKFTEGNLEKISIIWKFGWYLNLTKNDYCDLLEQKELHFLERFLLSFKYINHEEEYHDDFWDELYQFPFSSNYPLINSRLGKVLRLHILEVIEKGEDQSLIPLVAMGYINLLDPNEIVSLFKNTKLKLFTKIYLAYRNNPWEFSHFNPKFYTWKDSFNSLLEFIGLEAVFIDDDEDEY